MSNEMLTIEQRIFILRRRIELYRRYLREGIDPEKAFDYLHEIAEAEAELADITGKPKRKGDIGPPSGGRSHHPTSSAAGG